MWLFFGGFVYGLISMAVFLLLLVVVAVIWTEHAVGREIFEDEDDSLELFLGVVDILGAWRIFIYFIIALMWPIVVIVFALHHRVNKGRYFDDLPSWNKSLLLWFFLGFGKFSPAHQSPSSA